MGVGEPFFRKKQKQKEWSCYSELEDFRIKLKLNNREISDIAGIGKTTIYLWKKKGKVPTYMVSQIKEAFAEYYWREYNSKVKIIWGDHENEEGEDESS